MGLHDKEGEKLLFKEWQIETSSELLRQVLRPCLCPGNHEHGKSLGGGRLWRTARLAVGKRGQTGVASQMSSYELSIGTYGLI